MRTTRILLRRHSMLAILIFIIGCGASIGADMSISDGEINASFYDSTNNFNLHYISLVSDGKKISEWLADPNYGKLFEVTMFLKDDSGVPLKIDNNTACSSMSSEMLQEGNKKTLKLQWFGFDVRPQTSGQQGWRAVDPSRFLVAVNSGGGGGQAVRLSQLYSSSSDVWHSVATTGNEIVTTSFRVITPTTGPSSSMNVLTFYGCEGKSDSLNDGYSPFSYQVVVRYNSSLAKWSVRNYQPALENITGDVIVPGSMIDITVTANLANRTYTISATVGGNTWSNQQPAYWYSGADGTPQTGICFSFNSNTPASIFIDNVVVQNKFDAGGFESPLYQTGPIAMSYLQDPNGSHAIDVNATIVAYTDRKGIEWDIDVTNRCSRYGISAVKFPFLRFVPIDGTPENDTLVYPFQDGRILPNPFSSYNRVIYELGYWDFQYPTAGMNMQWGAFYDASLGGLYYATYDPDAFEKTYCYCVRDDGVYFRLQQEPENKNVAGVNYHSPYSFLTQYTKGHWYDAAQIYRAWAMNQSWTAQGPLYQRTDIPRYLTDSSLTFSVFTLDGVAEPLTVAQAVQNTQNIRNFFNPAVPTPLIWYGWEVWKPELSGFTSQDAGTNSGNYFPEKTGFASGVETLESSGVYVLPYVLSRLFDVPGGRLNVPSNWLPYTVKDVAGISDIWSPLWPSWVDMCRSTEFFQSYVQNVCQTLTANDYCKGAYLDCSDGMQKQCFDVTHGHPVGGGNYQAEGLHAMATRVRNSCRNIDSNSAIFGEGSADVFMDVIDCSYRFEAVHPAKVPLYAAVYGGYHMTEIGDVTTFTKLPEYKTDFDLRFRVVLGNQLTFGEKIGRFPTFNGHFFTDPFFAGGMQLIKKVADYRYAARDYLQYGRLLRPLTFNAPQPPLVSWFFGSGVPWQGHNVPMSQPAITSSIWESPDGRIGIVLYNITQTAQPYSFTLAASDYPLLYNKVNIYKMANQYGLQQLIGTNNSPNYTFTGTLAGDDIAFFTIESTCAALVGNFNNDCEVNFLDLSELLDTWLWLGAAGQIRQDIIPDGTVNLLDLAVFSQHWLEQMTP